MRPLPARYLVALLLLLGCLTPFLAGIHGPFLHDDYANLQLTHVGKPSLQAAYDVAFRNHSGPLRRPLANLSFAANYWWLGSDPFDFKLINLLLHGLCGLLVYALGKRLLKLLAIPLDAHGRHYAALVAMVLWTLHPLQVSTVLYVVQRMAQIAGLFSFAAVLLLSHWLEKGHRTTGASLAICAGFFACVALGLGGKESALLTPLLAGVVAFMASSQSTLQRDRPTLCVLMACVVLPLVAGAVVFMISPHWIMDSYADRDFTLWERLLTESTVLWFYLRLILLPWIPAMGLYHDDYPVYGAGDWQAWLATGAWILALALAWRYRRRMPLACFAILWFLAAHMLESSFIPLELVYEHRNYVALFGPALLIGRWIAPLLQRYTLLRRTAWLIPVLALGAATMTRSHQWSSGDLFSIYEHQHHPTSIRASFAEAARRVASHDLAGAEHLYEQIQAQAEHETPGKIWPLMLDPLLQCRLAGHPVRWQALRGRIKRNESLDKMLEFSSKIMSQVMAGTCKTLELDEYRDILKLAYRRSLARGDREQAEMAAIHLGWTGKSHREQAYALLWLKRAAAARPDGVEALFDLAYMYLNNGQLDDARLAIDALRQRAARYSLPIGYRIDELTGYLQQASDKAQ